MSNTIMLEVTCNEIKHTYKWLTPILDMEVPHIIELNSYSYKNKAFIKYLNTFKVIKNGNTLYYPITKEIEVFLNYISEYIDECKSLHIQYVRDIVTTEQYIKAFSNHVKKRKLFWKLQGC